MKAELLDVALAHICKLCYDLITPWVISQERRSKTYKLHFKLHSDQAGDGQMKTEEQQMVTT